MLPYKAVFEDIKGSNHGAVLEVVEKLKTWCAQILRNSDTDSSLSLYVVTLMNLLKAFSYASDLSKLFTADFENRCQLVKMLTETSSHCRLTRGFAIAAQGNQHLVDACTEASNILQMMPDVGEKLEGLIELVASPLEEGAEAEALDQQLQDMLPVLKHASAVVYLAKPGSALSKHLAEGIVSKLDSLEKLMQRRMACNIATTEELSAQLAVVTEASQQFPLNGYLLTMKQSLDRSVQQSSAAADVQTLVEKVNSADKKAEPLTESEINDIEKAADRCHGLPIGDNLDIFISLGKKLIMMISVEDTAQEQFKLLTAVHSCFASLDKVVLGKCKQFKMRNVLYKLKGVFEPLNDAKSIDKDETPAKGWLGQGQHHIIVRNLLSASKQLKAAIDADNAKLQEDDFEKFMVAVKCVLADCNEAVQKLGLRVKGELVVKIEALAASLVDVQHGLPDQESPYKTITKADEKSWKAYQSFTHKRFAEGNKVAPLKQMVGGIEQAS